MAFEKWPFMTIVQESTWNAFPDIYELFLWFVPLSKFFKDFAYRRVTNFMFVQWLISKQHCNSKCLFCLFFLSWFLFYFCFIDPPGMLICCANNQTENLLERGFWAKSSTCMCFVYENSKLIQSEELEAHRIDGPKTKPPVQCDWIEVWLIENERYYML